LYAPSSPSPPPPPPPADETGSDRSLGGLPRGLFSDSDEQQSQPSQPSVPRSIRPPELDPATRPDGRRLPGARQLAAPGTRRQPLEQQPEDEEADEQDEGDDETEPPKPRFGPPPRQPWMATPWNPQMPFDTGAATGPWGLSAGPLSPQPQTSYGLQPGGGAMFSPFQTGLLGGGMSTSPVAVPTLPAPTGTPSAPAGPPEGETAAGAAAAPSFYPSGQIWQNDVFAQGQPHGSVSYYYEPSRARLEGTGYYQPRYDWGREEWKNEPLSRPRNFR
jgi:hypothetical protein